MILNQHGISALPVGSDNSALIGGRVYPTVKIGNQVWIAENLDYKYDGLDIGKGSSDSQIRANYYNNDESTYGVNGTKYGLLYNWPAVDYLNNFRATLMPGWHVPSRNEWLALYDAVGGVNNAATKLKSATGWDTGNGDGSTAFNALPAGRQDSGNYGDAGTKTIFWTATDGGNNTGYAEMFFATLTSVIDTTSWRGYGYSVRLVKDA